MVMSIIGLASQAIAVGGRPDPITIDMQFEKKEVQSGEPIRLHYKVTGGTGEYFEICCTMRHRLGNRYEVKNSYTMTNDNYVDSEMNPLFEFDSSKPEGDILYIPTCADKVEFTMFAMDSDYHWSERFKGEAFVRGQEIKPVMIELTTDKNVIDADEPAHVHYKISGGSGNYEEIRYSWATEYNNPDEQTSNTYSKTRTEITEPEGNLYWTPELCGKTIQLNMSVRDHVNDKVTLSTSLDSPQIRYRKPNFEPIRIEIEPNTIMPKVGDKLRVHYKISGGSGKYKYSNYYFVVYKNGRPNRRMIDEACVSGELSDTEGYIDYEIKDEANEIELRFYVLDSLGLEAYRRTDLKMDLLYHTLTFNKVWKGGTENSIQFDMFNSLDEQVNSEDNASRKLITINKVSKDHWIVTAKIPAINDKNYVIEKPVLGYSTIYKNVGEHYGETDRCYAGGTIINTKIPKTGDDSRLKLFLTLFCISAVLLALNKRTTDSR